jgi:hypothetical protein
MLKENVKLLFVMKYKDLDICKFKMPTVPLDILEDLLSGNDCDPWHDMCKKTDSRTRQEKETQFKDLLMYCLASKASENDTMLWQVQYHDKFSGFFSGNLAKVLFDVCTLYPSIVHHAYLYTNPDSLQGPDVCMVSLLANFFENDGCRLDKVVPTSDSAYTICSTDTFWQAQVFSERYFDFWSAEERHSYYWEKYMSTPTERKHHVESCGSCRTALVASLRSKQIPVPAFWVCWKMQQNANSNKRLL